MLGMALSVLLVLVLIAVVVSVVVVLIVKAAKPKRDGSEPRPLSAGISPGMPPGWYPDQNDPNLLRYFDGRRWTSGTAPRG